MTKKYNEELEAELEAAGGETDEVNNYVDLPILKANLPVLSWLIDGSLQAAGIENATLDQWLTAWDSDKATQEALVMEIECEGDKAAYIAATAAALATAVFTQM